MGLAKLVFDVCKFGPTEYLVYYKKKHEYSDAAMLQLGCRALNIDDYGDESYTGELYLIKDLLPKVFESKELTFFDVGANVGNYSKILGDIWPTARIFSFEPNPAAFNSLNLLQNNSLQKYNIGFGNAKSTEIIYNYCDADLGTEHGSLLKGVFTDLHHSNDIKEIDISIEVLDEFCIENKIDKIDFMKIDTEGYEFEVLKGAKRMIEQDGISVIQLEFNEMNTVSKVFLLDFYNLLMYKYDFFRLKKTSIEALGEYSSFNEIFRYQNLVLINKNISKKRL